MSETTTDKKEEVKTEEQIRQELQRQQKKQQEQDNTVQQQHKDFLADTLALRAFDKSRGFAFRIVFSFVSIIMGTLAIILLVNSNAFETLSGFCELAIITFGLIAVLTGVLDIQFLVAYASAVRSVRTYKEIAPLSITETVKKYQQESKVAETKHSDITEANQAITRELKILQEAQQEMQKELQGTAEKVVGAVTEVKELSSIFKKQHDLVLASKKDVYAPSEEEIEKNSKQAQPTQKPTVKNTTKKRKKLNAIPEEAEKDGEDVKEELPSATSISDENKHQSKYNLFDNEDYDEEDIAEKPKLPDLKTLGIENNNEVNKATENVSVVPSDDKSDDEEESIEELSAEQDEANNDNMAFPVENDEPSEPESDEDEEDDRDMIEVF